MKKFLLTLSIQGKLGAIAVVLGFIAIFAGSPYDSSTAKMNTKELALIVETEADHISAAELADWIIKAKADYKLIDLRDDKSFEAYRIPGAVNKKITELNDGDLFRNEKIILYSEGGIHAAQAWFLLKAKGYKAVYTLLGGIDEWKDEILFPVIPDNLNADEISKYEKKKEVSKFFGGTPQTGSEPETSLKSDIKLPKLEMPSAVPSTILKKKKKEGC